MSAGIAVVLRCGDELAGIVESLRDITAAAGVTERVILAESITPARADTWLRGLSTDTDSTFLRVDRSESANLNDACALTSAPLLACLHAGDRIQGPFLERAARCLSERPEVEVVTCGIRVTDTEADSRPLEPVEGPVTLRALVENFDTMHPSSVFRRSAWERTGRFGAELALMFTDLWLRLLAIDGAEGVVIEDATLNRAARSRAWRRELAARTADGAVEALVARHQASFTGHILAVLETRERALWHLGPRYRRALARREDAQRELDRLAASIAEAQESIPPTPLALGDLRRPTPVSRYWGYERGVPVDRHYIERFLAEHQQDIRGVVLEIQEPDYTRRFGGERVERSEVLDLAPDNERATIVADLRHAGGIAADQFDCIILTQTVHVIDDMAAVITECARLLRPGGVLLATLPCSSRVCLEYGPNGDFWRVTAAGARALFEPVFQGGVEVQGRGNVLASAAFSYGLAGHELRRDELEHDDPYNPTLVCVRAVKRLGGGGWRSGSAAREPERGAILAYHRVGRYEPDPHRLTVATEVFREHMQELTRRFRPVELETLAEMARQGAVDTGSVAVTFDDGYVDALEVASPILSELRIPATFFLTVDRLDEPFEYWWDRLARAMFLTSQDQATLTLTLPTGELRLDTSTADSRAAAHRTVYESIVALPADQRDAAVDAVSEWAELGTIDPANRRLTTEEIRALSSRPGHSIGAHGVRHVVLPACAPAERRAELRDCRDALEALLGGPVTAFAYPYGAFDVATAAAAAEAGYRVAVTCDAGFVSAGSDPLALPRLEVPARPDGVRVALASMPFHAAARRP